ncbi:hypothetical protein E2P81_ATG05451 [Venturia nashicola]|nr:hypothetical protein E2P81_ATG05451 [Venturia nashicola]
MAEDPDFENVMAARAYENNLNDYQKNLNDRTDPFRDMKMMYAQEFPSLQSTHKTEAKFPALLQRSIPQPPRFKGSVPIAATEATVYWNPIFVKALDPPLYDLKTLRLVFNSDNPDPPIESWGALGDLLCEGLPNLRSLYIIYEIDVPPGCLPHVRLNGPSGLLKGGTRMKSVPESLPRNIRELVIDVKGYVNGPYAGERGRMLGMLRGMRTLFTYVPRLKLIAYTGWVLDHREQEKKWREGKMREED